MREIKFRAWWRAAKKMYLVSGIDYDATHKMSSIELLDPIEHTYHITEDIQPSELMQYTGLKDCKGQEIYEGDIVQYFGIRGVVTWVSNGPGFTIIRPDNSGACVLHAEWEVISNIYEHPELLKGE